MSKKLSKFKKLASMSQYLSITRIHSFSAQISKNFGPKITLQVLIGLLTLIAGCSATQVALDADLMASEKNHLEVFELAETLEVHTSNAKTNILRSSSRWELVGSISEGNVYRPKNHVLIVNSFDVHEAYIVVNSGNLIGYYLPIENTFIKTSAVSINLKKWSQK